MILGEDSQENTAGIAPFIIPRYLGRNSTRVDTSVGQPSYCTENEIQSYDDDDHQLRVPLFNGQSVPLPM